MSHSKNPARFIALAALVVIGGGAIAYALTGKKTEVIPEPAPVTSTAGTATTTASTTDTTAVVTSSLASTYKNGTYSATGSYLSPGGTEQLGVTVTLKDDVIVSASVTPKPVSEQGTQFQGIFSKNFKQYVIGKDISSIHLTTVSGSSLTPQGFNDALTKIEAQAKA